MTQRGPWPTRLEWRAVRDRVRLVEIVEMDIGPQDLPRLDLAPRLAAMLLSEDVLQQLRHVVRRAAQHGKPANVA